MSSLFFNKDVDKCTSLNLNYISYIGDTDKIYEKDYFKYRCNSDYIILKYLPSLYYPFNYKDIENTVKKIKEKIDSYSEKEKALDILKYNLTILNQGEQIYNINNLTYLTYFIIFFWSFILFLILRYIYVKFNQVYLYFILGSSLILLVICSLYVLIFTNQNI